LTELYNHDAIVRIFKEELMQVCNGNRAKKTGKGRLPRDLVVIKLLEAFYLSSMS